MATGLKYPTRSNALQADLPEVSLERRGEWKSYCPYKKGNLSQNLPGNGANHRAGLRSPLAHFEREDIFALNKMYVSRRKVLVFIELYRILRSFIRSIRPIPQFSASSGRRCHW